MKPILLIVDDDPQVLRAIESDLRQKYGNHFRVLKADSGTSALDLLKLLKLRNEQTALFLVDQRMPQMTGAEFLEQAMKIYHDSKRVLLRRNLQMYCTNIGIGKGNKDILLHRPSSYTGN